ncbi:MAG: hypothetical protein JW891_17820 [Candidatus Lokiarchaeota archaeon]|nr:hypothetical protein [Candidatus Lokiarchaeota archaeon]
MGFVEPTFEIDKKGRVICRQHTNYDYLKQLCEKAAANNSYSCDVSLTCATCQEYLNDNCYFTKSDIDKIEHDRTKTKLFLCKLCGNRIHRIWTVLYSLYNEIKYDVDIPLICCSCYDSLKSNSFMEKYKRRSYSIKFYLFLSILIIIDNLVFINPLYTTFSIINIFFAITCAVIYGRYLKRIKRGRDYYQKYFLRKENDQ